MEEPASRSTLAEAIEHVDVLIVGAGVSGIGSAYHLLQQRPGTSFIILESQNDYGGTWRTHRYPGIRSDSDLYTYGYRFKPWTGVPYASAGAILDYVGEVIEGNDLSRHIRFQHKITDAKWSSEQNRWAVSAVRSDTNEVVCFTTNFLWMCTGYYRHDGAYTPEWPGTDAFAGPIVHPQNWPTDLDYVGKRVVVIGSGATAATLIPAIADETAHVTMLQRSPTFYRTGRNAIVIADELRKLQIDEAWIHEIVRRKIMSEQDEFTRRTFSEPDVVKQELIENVRSHLGPEYDVDAHFTPTYRPWRQRIAFIPEADFFQAIRSGRASVVTGEIDRFTANGILLTSGQELEADIIVTATGFNLSVLGDIDFTVDCVPVNFADTVTYRGTMFTGVPNLAWVFGYLRASWTLRVDLIGDFVCRLLGHMQTLGTSKVTPMLRESDLEMALLPWVTEENFNAGYLLRNIHLLPHQGDKLAWQHTQDHWADQFELPASDLEDGTLIYG